MNYAVILSGGIGTRMHMGDFPKQYYKVKDRMILEYTLDSFENSEAVDRIVIVMAPAWQEKLEEELRGKYKKIFGFAKPGSIRQESILSGIRFCMDRSESEEDKVIIHDGVRPLASTALIERVLEAARHDGAAIPVVMLNDSVRQVTGDISHALDRSSLRAVQTPQAFEAKLLLDAYSLPYEPTFTDDASVVERAGHVVTLVEGEPHNLKITRPMDLALAEYLLNHDA